MRSTRRHTILDRMWNQAQTQVKLKHSLGARPLFVLGPQNCPQAPKTYSQDHHQRPQARTRKHQTSDRIKDKVALWPAGERNQCCKRNKKPINSQTSNFSVFKKKQSALSSTVQQVITLQQMQSCHKSAIQRFHVLSDHCTYFVLVLQLVEEYFLH